MVTEQEDVLRCRLVELEAEIGQLRQQLGEAAAAEERRATKLMADVQHRVRNMLATVRAIVSRTAVNSHTVEEFSAHLTGRVETLARLQGAISRSGEAGLDLEELVREEFVAQGGFIPGQCFVDGPSLSLPGRYAEVLGLAVHELATNSVKFGALSVQEGRVAVGWQVEQPNGSTGLTLRWDESGGPRHSAADRRGFGRELLEDGLSYQLDAKTSLEFRPDGLLCTIEVVFNGGRLSVSPASASP